MVSGGHNGRPLGVVVPAPVVILVFRMRPSRPANRAFNQSSMLNALSLQQLDRHLNQPGRKLDAPNTMLPMLMTPCDTVACSSTCSPTTFVSFDVGNGSGCPVSVGMIVGIPGPPSSIGP